MSLSVSIGERLREERHRLGLSQPVLGEIGGVTKKTQMLYESGGRTPDGIYLASIAANGADVQYILTAGRSAQALTNDEIEMLEAFRAAPLAVKAAAIGALQGGSNPSTRTKQVVYGSVGQQAAGDVVNQKGVDIDVGTKAKGRRKR